MTVAAHIIIKTYQRSEKVMTLEEVLKMLQTPETVPNSFAEIKIIRKAIRHHIDSAKKAALREAEMMEWVHWREEVERKITKENDALKDALKERIDEMDLLHKDVTYWRNEKDLSVESCIAQRLKDAQDMIIRMHSVACDKEQM
jgi:hypothetical protein